MTFTVNALKFQTLFTFSSKKVWVIRALIHKRVVRIAKWEDPDQAASALFVWAILVFEILEHLPCTNFSNVSTNNNSLIAYMLSTHKC